jgi:hypothetical protein
VVEVTDQFDLPRNENDQASSVKVNDRCYMTLFTDYNKAGESDFLDTDVSFLKLNDKVSSLSCNCLTYVLMVRNNADATPNHNTATAALTSQTQDFKFTQKCCWKRSRYNSRNWVCVRKFQFQRC